MNNDSSALQSNRTPYPLTQNTTTQTTQDSSFQNNLFFMPVTDTQNIFYIIFGVVGLILNGYVVTVIALHTPMHKKLTNVIIGNGCLIDGLAALVLLLETLFSYDYNNSGYTANNIGDEILCRVWYAQMPLWGTLDSSTYNIVALTFERYIAIVHPIWHKTKLENNKLIIGLTIACIWFIGPAYNAAYIIPISGISENGSCSFFVFSSPNGQTALGIMTFLFEFLVPLILIVYGYLRIVWTLHKRVKLTTWDEVRRPVARVADIRALNENDCRETNAKEETGGHRTGGRGHNDGTDGYVANTVGGLDTGTKHWGHWRVGETAEGVRHGGGEKGSGEKGNETKGDGQKEGGENVAGEKGPWGNRQNGNGGGGNVTIADDKVVAPDRGPIAVVKEVKRNEGMVKARKNVLRTSALIAFFFVFCWSWNEIYSLGYNLGSPCCQTQSIFVTTTISLVCINCCVNPIIYSLTYTQLREGARIVFGRLNKSHISNN